MGVESEVTSGEVKGAYMFVANISGSRVNNEVSTATTNTNLEMRVELTGAWNSEGKGAKDSYKAANTGLALVENEVADVFALRLKVRGPNRTSRRLSDEAQSRHTKRPQPGLIPHQQLLHQAGLPRWPTWPRERCRLPLLHRGTERCLLLQTHRSLRAERPYSRARRAIRRRMGAMYQRPKLLLGTSQMNTSKHL